MTNPLEAASEERAKIVAWLFGLTAWRSISPGHVRAWTPAALADAIERGEHDYVDLPRMQLGPVDAPA